MRAEHSINPAFLKLVEDFVNKPASRGNGGPQTDALVAPSFSYLGEPITPSRGIPRTASTEKQTQRHQPTPLGRTVPQEVRRRQMRRPTPESRGRR